MVLKSNFSYSFRLFIYLILFIIAVYLRWANTNILLLDSDSTGYLEPSLKLLNEGCFDHKFSRSYPYPLFCYSVLYIFNDINAILHVQHLLSIISAIIFLFLLEKEIRKVNQKSIVLITLSLAVIFFIGCFWNGNLIFFEKSLRPEGLILPSSLLIFYLLYFYTKKILSGIYSAYILLLINSVLLISAYLHPRMALAFYSISFILLAHFWLYSRRRIIQKLTVTIFSLLIAFSIILPERSLINKYDQLSDNFIFKQFFFSNLRAVDVALKNGEYVNETFDKKYLPILLKGALNDSSINTNWFPILKYNIDKAQYNDFPIYRDQMKSENQLEKDETYFLKWFNLLITKYPKEIIKKTGNQFLGILLYPNITYINWQRHSKNLQSFQKNSEQFEFLHKNLNYKPDIYIQNKFQWIFNVINFIGGYFVKITLLIGLIYFTIQTIRQNIYLFDLLIYLVLIITIFTVSFIHTFDNTRYSQSLSPYALLLVCLFLYRTMPYFINKIKR